MTAADIADAREDDRAYLAELLPKGAQRHIAAILDYFMPTQVDAVDIRGARVAVEEVAAFGLVVEVDANGNAATVRFPHGADITEVS